MMNNLYTLYDKYSFAVYNQCFKVVKTKEDAEDLCQEIFSFVVPVLLEKYKGLDSIELGKILIRSAHNKAIDSYRKKLRQNEVLLSEIHHPYENNNENEINRELEKLLIELKSEEVEVIKLRHIWGFNWQEISNKIGLSVIGARKKEGRAMEKLNEKWKSRNKR